MIRAPLLKISNGGSYRECEVQAGAGEEAGPVLHRPEPGSGQGVVAGDRAAPIHSRMD
jgi:hypothetical protein